MRYIGHFVIVSGHDIQEKNLRKSFHFRFIEGGKLREHFVCTPKAT